MPNVVNIKGNSYRMSSLAGGWTASPTCSNLSWQRCGERGTYDTRFNRPRVGLVSTILPRVVRANSQDEVQQIVREEFEYWFGPDTTTREASLEVIAAEVFEAVVNRR
jgi:hypothetical protein